MEVILNSTNTTLRKRIGSLEYHFSGVDDNYAEACTKGLGSNASDYLSTHITNTLSCFLNLTLQKCGETIYV